MSAVRQEFIVPCQDLIFILLKLFIDNRLHAFSTNARRPAGFTARFGLEKPRVWLAATLAAALTRTLTAV
jgi:hypothetical protein